MRILLPLMALLLSTKAHSQPYLIGQTGGYAGVVAAGAGYNWNYLSTAIMAGFAPAFVTGENLWSVTLKNQWNLGVAHIGIANSFSLDKDTFLGLPSRYPKGYYPPSGLMSGPYAGLHANFDEFTLYGEAASLDYYLEMKVRNPQYISWADVITYAFGVQWNL